MNRYIKINPKKKNISKLNYFYGFNKQRRFVLQTVILTVGLLMTQLIWDDYRFFLVIVLSFLSYILTAWSLTEDVSGIEWFTLFILPVIFTASLSLFYFLLPARWIIRLITIFVFAVGTYAIIKAENIFNVAQERSIPLLKVAQTSSLVITLVVVFFTSNIIFALKLPFWSSMFLMSTIIFLLALQSLWTTKLEEKISFQTMIYTFIVSLSVGELTAVLSFWPIQLATASILITSFYYAQVGIIQQHFQGRLFINTMKEYLIAFIFTLFISYLTTFWD